MEYRISTFIPRPVEDVFGFCSSRSGFMDHFPYRIDWVSGEEIWHEGDELDFRFRVGPVWIRYVAKIKRFKQNESFVDVMKKGPYKYFEHEHHFQSVENGTVYTDALRFSLGLGKAVDFAVGLPITASTFKKRHALMVAALSQQPAQQRVKR